MDKNKKDERNQQNESILKEKTNEDYNKQNPNPNNPNLEQDKNDTTANKKEEQDSDKNLLTKQKNGK
ncbi:MAG: hypothetical protein H7239_02925 [Flavobacterium sp.]|nr:hypothetical protein [Flavobacterium sp.]